MNNSTQETKKEYKQSNKAFHKIIKRLLDIIFSSLTLILLSPILLIIALLIIIDDGLPIFFKQKRSGKGDIPFKIFKFRSMKNKQVAVPSNSHNDYNWENGVPDSFVFKMSSEDNPNITKIGRFIRKYSLDELPQFINVLKGDMSLVGPRPEILPISDCYNEHQKRRLEVKPGITGWAQANGRSEMNHGEKIKHDLYYVDNFSVWLDIKIVLMTIKIVVLGRGSV